jgi:SAM-dependent methyltransferase
VAHLQCNCGQDTLSLVRQLGAARVIGVDISDAAIAEARKLSEESGTQSSVSFERNDVTEWLEKYRGERFDVLFASYGWLSWLGDLPGWARGVASVLKPGGRLVLIEFHPLVWSFGEGGALTGDAYFADEPGGVCNEPGGVSDYVASSGTGLIPEGMQWAAGEVDFQNTEPTVEFQHTVGDLISALANAGLLVSSMREYPYSNGCQLFGGMKPMPGRRFSMPEGLPSMPLMLSMVAVHRHISEV